MFVLLMTWFIAVPCMAQDAAEPSMPNSVKLTPGGEALMALADTVSAEAPGTASVSPDTVLVPVGRWMAVGAYAGFTYMDPEAGLSLRAEVPAADVLDDPSSLQSPDHVSMTYRLSWRGPALRELTEAEREERQLPKVPGWLSDYGEQPKAGTLWGAWRLHPNLFGRSLPDWPDDVEVLFDDQPPHPEGFEVMWVSIRSCKGRRCRGTLINEPFHLSSVGLGDTVCFSRTSVGPTEYLLPCGVNGPRVTRQRPAADP